MRTGKNVEYLTTVPADYVPGATVPRPILPSTNVSGHIIEDESIVLPQERYLNFVGAGVTATDNPSTGATDVTIPGGTSVMGHIIQDEGVDLPQEVHLNFVGSGVTATDDSGNTASKVTIKRAVVVCLCAAFTPNATGGDVAEYPIPFDPNDGATSITWTLRRITLRVQTAGGAPAVTIEKSTASGAFSATSIGSVTMGSGNYEVSSTSSLGTVASGNKIRMNPTVLGTASNWTVTVEMMES